MRYFDGELSDISWSVAMNNADTVATRIPDFSEGRQRWRRRCELGTVSIDRLPGSRSRFRSAPPGPDFGATSPTGCDNDLRDIGCLVRYFLPL